MDKRTFLKNMAALSMGSVLTQTSLANMATTHDFVTAGEPTDVWQNVRTDYDLPDFINLENGYYCIQPRPILEKYLAHIRYVNKEGAHYMRTVQADNKKASATKLAAMAGCSPEELIITRNTTESLDMIIGGLDWKQGDEAVMAVHDYGAMLDMFRQVGERYGVVRKAVTVPLNPSGDEEIVEVYRKAITPRTRLLMVCHMINITGHILPVKKICDMARGLGVLTLVDGAHALAHLQYRIDELGCDFYGASLHKWLSVPIGAGLLYVRKEHISKVWPVFAEAEKDKNDIARLNHTGTHPVATDLTIPDAIDYYYHIGPAAKEQRLRYLQRYWTEKVRHLPHVVMYTPEAADRTGAIATVGIKNTKPADFADYLFKKHNIYTVAIDNNGIQGCRITPNVYTTTDELDTLVKAVERLKM